VNPAAKEIQRILVGNVFLGLLAHVFALEEQIDMRTLEFLDLIRGVAATRDISVRIICAQQQVLG
jgi:hypothetical protein